MAELGAQSGLVEFADALVDDPVHITRYRAIGLAKDCNKAPRPRCSGRGSG